ncbi:hypothetical protein SAM_0832 [Streptococcus agalactiae CJB111]|nr:hypothetical protein SAM_0832 [Streptococcus agalactiae CJB111]
MSPFIVTTFVPFDVLPEQAANVATDISVKKPAASFDLVFMIYNSFLSLTPLLYHNFLKMP